MKNIYRNILVVMMLLTLSFTANAQDPDDPLSQDPGAAPIGDYVPLMLVAAVGLGYFLTQKREIKNI